MKCVFVYNRLYITFKIMSSSTIWKMTEWKASEQYNFITANHLDNDIKFPGEVPVIIKTTVFTIQVY